MIKTLQKNQLDEIWDKIVTLENKPKRSQDDEITLTGLKRTAELNARKVAWIKRGIMIIEGGKKEVA